MAMDIEAQYDKIYRYCYFQLHNRETAEDITQEAFLRYLERYHFSSSETALKYLYTIARNLCIDEFRKPVALSLEENARGDAVSFSGKSIRAASPGSDMDSSRDNIASSGEDAILTTLALQKALRELSGEEQELLLLRYVNEVPVGVIADLFGISRFALRRRFLAATEKLRANLGKEDFS